MVTFRPPSATAYFVASSRTIAFQLRLSSAGAVERRRRGRSTCSRRRPAAVEREVVELGGRRCVAAALDSAKRPILAFAGSAAALADRGPRGAVGRVLAGDVGPVGRRSACRSRPGSRPPGWRCASAAAVARRARDLVDELELLARSRGGGVGRHAVELGVVVVVAVDDDAGLLVLDGALVVELRGDRPGAGRGRPQDDVLGVVGGLVEVAGLRSGCSARRRRR